MSRVLVVRTMEHLGYDDKGFMNAMMRYHHITTLACNSTRANLDNR